MWEWNDYANIPDDELYHYGILGMKWGFRRAFYKTYSADRLRKSAKGIQNDITKLQNKAMHKRHKAIKFEYKRDKHFAKGDSYKGGKFGKKAYKAKIKAEKREKTIKHNKKLLELYRKRLSEIDPKFAKSGKEYIDLYRN